MKRLQNKVAFITGAARGQGRSHALKLAEEGADIIAIDICEPFIDTTPYEFPTYADLEETARQVEALDRRIHIQKADVRSEDSLRSAVEAGVAELGRLDVVCANAGIHTVQAPSTLELSAKDWQDMIDVNLTGVFNTCKVSAPHLIEAGGGCIVITSSIGGMQGIPPIGHYVSAKTGIMGLMRTLAVELGRHNIRVNTIHPTQVRTDMIMNEPNYRLFAGPDAEVATEEHLAQGSMAMHALPNVPWLEPQDVSNAIAFLASDEARYITGHEMVVDAGALIAGR